MNVIESVERRFEMNFVLEEKMSALWKDVWRIMATPSLFMELAMIGAGEKDLSWL